MVKYELGFMHLSKWLRTVFKSCHSVKSGKIQATLITICFLFSVLSCITTNIFSYSKKKINKSWLSEEYKQRGIKI